ncbi:Cytochrome c oxidase (B(O/a)3-type) chain I [Paramagnetospirillum magnetotacticum MS-1]|uniref:Cytochrome c oxidase (B(O/a)3-type) chain I n=1 Tax=Paramagnetospirillum magnetotacticum MS-1 TaxID=272627 RepID=A0A0C2YG33_PARME|nr:cbb3-type cytochrome c oxidase subunit I [Paramagnetospirillum magnetotacticum]KIL98689.1 Cytochrome c oxidase (B(O/a)3-type) chain I [Paramagnetospirillum magnetotacticum MS-1]
MVAKPIFRTCGFTGLKIHDEAEKLIKINAVTAIVVLAVGGLFGLLVALTRWPTVHLLPADLFYLALTAHGIDILIVWCIFFEVALMYFASAILLQSRLATPKMGWVAYALMVLGAGITNWKVLEGNSSVMMTSYVPMQADPLFYVGLILFAVGALIACFIFLGTLVVAKAEKTYEGSIPLVTFGALTACIIAIYTISSGAIILIPTFLWSVGLISHIDPLMYKVVWWGMGHSSQQINVAAHIAVWYAIAAILFGAKPLSEKVSRCAYLTYIFFLQIASAHHLLVEPGLSSAFKIFNTSYGMYLAVLGSMIHGLTVPGCIEAAQRKKGFNNGLFEWLRKAPWGNPIFSGMFLSLILFGFLGGISGVTMGVEQINIMIHNTIYVPGHFHATVAAGTTLAFMAITYFLVPVLFGRELILPGLAKLQPYLFGLGMGVFSLFMMGAGTLGVSRRHWDMAFSDAPHAFAHAPAAFLMMGIVGVAACVAVVGGALFVLVIVGSVLFGKPVVHAPAAPAPAPSPVASYGNAEHVAVPGTFALALLFLTVFVLYYFVNWKYLASTWIMS